MGLFSGILDTVTDFFDGGVTDLLGAGLSFAGGQKTNQQNAALSREQMAFQERMRDTSYQAAVKDLEAAGLNPMLAYGQGGAATPSGAMATMQNPAETGVNTALAAKRNRAEVENMREQNNQIKSQTALNQAQAIKAKADAALSSAGAAKTVADTSESNVWSDLYKSLRTYTQPASSAASNKDGGMWDSIKKGLQKLYPPDPKTGGYHPENFKFSK